MFKQRIGEYVELESIDELLKKTDSGLEEESKYREFWEEIKYNFKNLGTGLGTGLILVGTGIFSGLFGYLFVLSDGPRLLIGMFELAAILGVSVGLLISIYSFFYSIYDLIMGANLKTPEKAASTFYGAVFGNSQNFGRAWKCLSTKAKSSFKDIEEFKQYWGEKGKSIVEGMHNVLADVYKEYERPLNDYGIYGSSIEYFKIRKDLEKLCISDFNIVVTYYLKDASSERYVEHSAISIAQTRAFFKIGNKWHISHGTIELPSFTDAGGNRKIVIITPNHSVRNFDDPPVESCIKCGNSTFEYDDYYKEYICDHCGWIVEKTKN